MGLDHHKLSARAFAALAAGGSGPAVIESLRLAQYSKYALLIRGASAGSREATEAYGLLGRAQRKDPAAVAAVVRHPSVGAWAYRTVRALRGGPQFPGAAPEGLSNVAAAAAIRAGLSTEIEVRAMDGIVILPSLGAAEASGGSTATVRTTLSRTDVRGSHGSVAIPADYHETTPGWRPLRPVLTGAFKIVVDDVDPFRMPTAPHLATAPDLSQWRSAFAAAWALLRKHHPGVAGEVAAMIVSVVPLASPPHGYVSSSSSEAFGTVAMSEPSDPVELAVTLAHEVQHMKLSAMLDLIQLTRPDDGSRYYAPWREDPRPAGGLLQGAYAYLGVTGFWRRQRRVPAEDFVAEIEFARWRAAAAYVCEVLLASGQLTTNGERFVRMMARTLDSWCDEPVPDKALRAADEESERHTARWEASYGPIPAP